MPHRITLSTEIPYDPLGPILSPAWLDDARMSLRGLSAHLPLSSRAAIVADRLLGAVELGAEDFDPRRPEDRPRGDAATPPVVRLSGYGGVELEWESGERYVRVEVDSKGEVRVARRADESGLWPQSRMPPGHPLAVDAAREAVRWVFGRDE